MATLSFGAPVAAQSGKLNPAQEQVAVAALKECFAQKSTGQDRITLAKWFVVILAGSPSVEGVAKVDPGVKEKLDTGVARLLTRLLTSDCAAEARPLWQAHSKAGMKAAGETLGRLAFQEVLSGDSELFNGYAAKLNPEDFKVLEE